MRIVIEGATLLPDGLYGTRATLVDNVLVLTVDLSIDPDDCTYPVTKGTFI